MNLNQKSQKSENKGEMKSDGRHSSIGGQSLVASYSKKEILNPDQIVKDADGNLMTLESF